MSKNDKKIRVYQAKVEEKREELGYKPTPQFITNKLIALPDGTVNINVLRTQSAIGTVAMQLGLLLLGAEKAQQLLGGLEPPAILLEGTDIMDSIHDLKEQLDLVKWNEQAKELATMEDKLKGLLSEEARVEDELSELGKLL